MCTEVFSAPLTRLFNTSDSVAFRIVVRMSARKKAMMPFAFHHRLSAFLALVDYGIIHNGSPCLTKFFHVSVKLAVLHVRQVRRLQQIQPS